MGRVPLIAFRHAMRKAGEKGGADKPFPPALLASWGFQTSPDWSKSSAKPVSSSPRKSNNAVRLEKPLTRAALSDSEMEAVMLGGAP